jgi:hypothetical protein
MIADFFLSLYFKDFQELGKSTKPMQAIQCELC